MTPISKSMLELQVSGTTITQVSGASLAYSLQELAKTDPCELAALIVDLTTKVVGGNPSFLIAWSEFHYHLFSHLLSLECPRELAEGLDLKLFPDGPVPNEDRMRLCVAACMESESGSDLNDRLTALLVEWS